MTTQQHIELARRNRRHLLAHIDDETLKILDEHFQTHLPAYQRTASGSYDPIAAAIRDGQREVILYLRHQLQLARQENND
ncbi:MAG: hypothetical protein ACI4O9_08090 [Akkermansia sp.]